MRQSWELELDHQQFMDRVRAMVRPQPVDPYLRGGADAALTVKIREKARRSGRPPGHYGPNKRRRE